MRMRILKEKAMDNFLPIEGGGYTAVIHPSRGANCISLRHESGASLLREPPRDGILDNPYLYGMPILFPVNRIAGGEFSFEGRLYRFPINEPNTGCHLHGFLHETPFNVIEKEQSRVLLRYEASEDAPYLSFPHAFSVTMEYALDESGFSHTVAVTNHSDTRMPLFLGFHTTFNTCFLKNSRPENIRAFTDITEEYERNLEKDYLPTGKKPPFDAVSLALSKGRYRPFEAPTSRHYRGNGLMMLSDTENRIRMVYENDAAYKFRLIFNGGEAGYICLEPQTCLANCQNSPFTREEGGFDFIEAGATKTFRSKIYLEEF